METTGDKAENYEWCFAEPEQHNIIDTIDAASGLGHFSQETLEQIRLRYPQAERMRLEDFCAAKAARQDAAGEWQETTVERYDEMLCVLPTAFMRNGVFLVGEPVDHHARTGEPRFECFKTDGIKYWFYTKPMTRDVAREVAMGNLGGAITKRHP